MRLAILIPTLNEPWSIKKLTRLNNIIDPQIDKYKGQVYKEINDAGRSMLIGTKRNELIKNTDSDYFVFIDCDDVVPSFYVDEMMKAIEQGPDVISFIGHMTTDGAHRENFTIKLGSEYVSRGGHHYRWPNHLACMRRDRVEHIKFPDVKEREDFLWSEQIHKRKLLQTEIHLNKELYWYDFISPHLRK